MEHANNTAAAHCAALAARLSEQAALALQDLPQRVHPLWVDLLEVDPGVLASGGPRFMNAVLQARFDLRWPDLSAASHALELTWLLPPAQVRQVCAARALYGFRGLLARTVDAATRRGARLLLGSEVFNALVQLPERRREERPLPALEPEGIVVAGWGLLGSQLAWRDVRLRRLVELALPPAATRARQALWRSREHAAEHAEFVTAVKYLFPEHQWLFGSELASLKSA